MTSALHLRPLRHLTAAACLGAITLTAACAGDTSTPATDNATPDMPPLAQATTVTGCVRGGDAEGTHVLVTEPEMMGAAVDRATRGQNTTYTYVLVGPDLDRHVGRRVAVTGTIEARDDLEVEEQREQTGAPTTVDGETVTPTVEVEESAVIEMRRLRVAAVQGSGEDCTPVAQP